jgi:hypothetical protein
MMSNLETLKMYLETLEDIQENIENIANHYGPHDPRPLRTAKDCLSEPIAAVKVAVEEREAAALRKWVETFAPVAPLDMPIFTQTEQVQS